MRSQNPPLYQGGDAGDQRDINVTPRVWEKLPEVTSIDLSFHFSQKPFELTAMDHVFQSLSCPKCLSVKEKLATNSAHLFWLGISNKACHTRTIRKVIPFQQIPGFVLPDLPCAIFPTLGVASLDSRPDSSVMPLPHPARGTSERPFVSIFPGTGCSYRFYRYPRSVCL